MEKLPHKEEVDRWQRSVREDHNIAELYNLPRERAVFCGGVGEGWLPRWRSGKEPTCQCRRWKRCRFSPWVGKIPWRRKWQPTPVFLPGKSHGQRSLVGYYSPCCFKKSDKTEQAHTHACTLYFLAKGWRERNPKP